MAILKQENNLKPINISWLSTECESIALTNTDISIIISYDDVGDSDKDCEDITNECRIKYPQIFSNGSVYIVDINLLHNPLIEEEVFTVKELFYIVLKKLGYEVVEEDTNIVNKYLDKLTEILVSED